MLHRASLVPSLVYGWITATLCIRACQTLIFKGYRECRTLLHELFAKLHDANITQMTFLRISIGYRCMAESTTRLPSSDIKPSNYKNLRIWLVYSHHIDSRVSWGHLRLTYCQNSLHRQTLLNVSSHAAPHHWNSLPLFVCTSSRLLLKTLCLQDISNTSSSPGAGRGGCRTGPAKICFMAVQCERLLNQALASFHWVCAYVTSFLAWLILLSCC